MTAEHLQRKDNEISHVLMVTLFSGMTVMNCLNDVEKRRLILAGDYDKTVNEESHLVVGIFHNSHRF
jgi:hypothetical protein